MVRRCKPENAAKYPKYAGVYLDPRWLSFEDFYADMGDCPDGHSIDRMKSELGYQPGNCRWATVVEQANNRKNTRYVTYQGVTKPLAVWAREVGLPPRVAFSRFAGGWDPERIFTKIRRGCPRIYSRGKRRS